MKQLEESKRSFNPAQLSGLEQRMALLNSFMDKNAKGLTPNRSRFAPGQLTIIDLSDPFVDSASACGLFEIITRLFVRADVGTGKVLVVDEAHKYLSTNNSSSGLTNALLTLTREQRHLAMRVIISTQGGLIPSIRLQANIYEAIYRTNCRSCCAPRLVHCGDIAQILFAVMVGSRCAPRQRGCHGGGCIRQSSQASDWRSHCPRTLWVGHHSTAWLSYGTQSGSIGPSIPTDEDPQTHHK